MTIRETAFKFAAMAGASLVGLSLAVGPGSAQTPPPLPVRGAIVSFASPMLVVKSREGADVSIKLADNPRIVGIVKASLADIKPGSFIGTSSVPKEGSTSRALEIHILPEALRGAGEGDFPWDLAPGSSMTNGTVGNPVTSADGTSVTVSYKGGERKIVIQPDTAIVTYAAASLADLKVGAPVFVIARKQADDSLLATSVSVGKDGVAPPM